VRHSLLKGLRAGATTWMPTVAGVAATLIALNSPSGKRTFTPLKPTRALPNELPDPKFATVGAVYDRPYFVESRKNGRS